MAKIDNIESFLEREFSLTERINNYKNKKAFSLEIETTSICNSYCPYCYNSSLNNYKGSFFDETTCRDLIKSAGEYGIKEIWWLGGEPMLNPHLFEFISYAKENNIQKHLVFTNGILLNEKQNCNNLVKYSDKVVFHLDTIDIESYIKLHQNIKNIDKIDLRNSHEMMVNGIYNLLNSGYPSEHIRLNITVSKPILDSLRETISWAIEELNISMVTLIPVFACGRGQKLPIEFYPDKYELMKAFRVRSEIENRPFLLSLGPAEYCKQYQITNCYIDVNGEVFPYAGIDIKCGNINTDGFKDIMTKYSEKLFFQDILNDHMGNVIDGPCGNCVNEKYCFGTRTIAYRNSNNLKGSDPSCWKSN